MIALENQALSERIAGSFRDPSGYVFRRQGRVLRAIDENCLRTLRALEESGLLRELTASRAVIGTRFVADEELLRALRGEHAGFVHFLEHDPIETITYPSEW